MRDFDPLREGSWSMDESGPAAPTDLARRARNRMYRRRRIGVALAGVAAVGGAVAAVRSATRSTPARTTASTVAAVVETSTAPSSTAPAALATSVALTTTSAVSVPDIAAYRLVTRRDRDLEETTIGRNGTATTKVVAKLLDVPGAIPVFYGTKDHVLVTYLGRVTVYDPSTWAAPVDAGTYANLGLIVTERGFWAANDNGATWQLHDWSGQPVGPTVATKAQDTLPIGPAGDGVALLVKETFEILIAEPNGVRVSGVGRPIAANGTHLAYQAQSGDINIVNVQTAAVSVISKPPETGPAQTLGPGAFSPDGSQLAVALSDNAEPYAARGVLVAPITGGTGETFPELVGFGVQWTHDGTALVITGEDKAIRYELGPASQYPIDVQAQNGVAILSP
jgi:hypothetical protein